MTRNGGSLPVSGALRLLIAVMARATTDPVRGVRAALAQVEAGDLDVRIPLYDTSDVGLLQAGFNDMARGLRERGKRAAAGEVGDAKILVENVAAVRRAELRQWLDRFLLAGAHIETNYVAAL